MPNPGQANNPSGINNFQGFGDEAPYGEATADNALAAGAPIAGAPLTVGALGAPKRLQKQAGRKAPVAQPQAATAPPDVPQAPGQGVPQSSADQWSLIMESPLLNTSPVIQQWAEAAASGK